MRSGGRQRVSPGKGPFPWHCPHLSAIRQPDVGLRLFKRGVGKRACVRVRGTKRWRGGGGGGGVLAALTAAGVLCHRSLWGASGSDGD